MGTMRLVPLCGGEKYIKNHAYIVGMEVVGFSPWGGMPASAGKDGLQTMKVA
jgi:hypothetical protein